MTKDVKFSNIKGVLIFFVVLGHLLLIVRGDMEPLIILIYSFHMPAFIFLNGYFAKNVTWKKVLNLLLLYIIFQSFYAVVTYLTHYGEIFTFRFTTPIFHLWYLVSLACFYAVAILLHKIGKYRVWSMLIIAAILIVSAGIRWWATVFLIENPAISGQFLSIQRTFVFFPFFLLGFYINKETMGKCSTALGNFKFKVLLSAVLIFFILYVLSNNPLRFENAFYGFLQSSAFSSTIPQFLKIEFQQYIVALIMITMLFMLASNRESTLTKWGDNSLVIFLLHPIFFFIIRMFAADFVTWNPFVKLAFVIGISIFACSSLVALSSHIRWLLNPLDSIQKLRQTEILEEEV
ncbi:acyltransferase family protein [Listeria cornellensis]|uniref:Acyltransferase family protein n=1 Tax=Listeria cornellensis FSL F6-0969 TaxID=1265820 RepID=W7BHA7_9LIST|nr:acyltransferase family protein [Listeria cornellensis]EUJ26454.1 acyltransferase family protein [Listeria cornellensis FSL F6-0969]